MVVIFRRWRSKDWEGTPCLLKWESFPAGLDIAVGVQSPLQLPPADLEEVGREHTQEQKLHFPAPESLGRPPGNGALTYASDSMSAPPEQALSYKVNL